MWNVLQIGSDIVNLRMNNDNPFRKRTEQGLFKKKQRHKTIRIEENIHQEIKIYAVINNTNVVDLIDNSLQVIEPFNYGDRVTYKSTSPIKISFEAHNKLKILSSEHGVSITQVATEHLRQFIKMKE